MLVLPLFLMAGKEDVSYLMKRYLANDREVSRFVDVSETGFTVKNGKGEVEHALQFGSQTAPVRPPGPFRVALDPGHFGGSYARLENKWLKVDGVELCEGDLTLQTALHLKALLEQEGIEVFLTRTERGKGAIKEPFQEGDDFAEYNRRDLHKRVEAINAFHPDLTLMIHYNVHTGSSNVLASTSQNYCVAFVPGAFCKGELDIPEDRAALFRLLATDDIARSVELSQMLIRHLGFALQVPIKSHEHYMDAVCKRVGKGLYARNLALTRLVQGPLAYLEVLCMDCKEEIVGLKEGTRLKEAAVALAEGIRRYKAKHSFP